MPFVDLPITVDDNAIEQDVYERLAEAFPGWEPSDANLEVWIVKAISEMAGDLAGLAAEVPSAIFREFGSQIVGIPQNDALPAQALATWTAIDNAGYTIPEGAQFGIQVAGDEIVAFAVDSDSIIAPGSTSIAGVSAHAVVDGVQGNGLSGAATAIDALAFVDSISLDAPTDGGADAESDDEYLDRLAAEMRLLTPRPILPGDAEILARRSAEVERALALDGYDPDTDTWNNDRELGIALIDDAGEEVSVPTQDEVLALLDSMRELNFVFKIVDPSYSTINVNVQAMARPGFAPDEVDASVTAALEDWLAPSRWGRADLDDARSWRRAPTVRQSDLIAVVKAVQGVDYIEHLYLAISPTAATGGADLTLPGAAPLTRPGTLAVTIDAP